MSAHHFQNECPLVAADEAFKRKESMKDLQTLTKQTICESIKDPGASAPHFLNLILIGESNEIHFYHLMMEEVGEACLTSVQL